MTPSAALLDHHLEGRPLKKQRLDSAADNAANPDEAATIWSHPLGIRPSGNAFTATANLKTAIGTFALLPDELLTQFLEYLDFQDLLRLGATCRALHAFTRSEELWKALLSEYVFMYSFALCQSNITQDHNPRISNGVARGGQPSCPNHVLKNLMWTAATSFPMPSIGHISVLTCPWSPL